MIGPEGDTRQRMKRERQSIRGERTSARSSWAIKSKSEVGDNSGGESDEGQDKAGEKGTRTTGRRQRSNWGTSRRGEPSGWSVQGKAAQCRQPEKKAKRGGEVEAGDHRVDHPVGAGLRQKERPERGEWRGGAKAQRGRPERHKRRRRKGV